MLAIAVNFGYVGPALPRESQVPSAIQTTFHAATPRAHETTLTTIVAPQADTTRHGVEILTPLLGC